MREIVGDLSHWLALGEQIALATVVWAEGPSPRPLGARMAITASGKMTGSVSGGCVEGAVFQEAQSVLEGEPSKRLRYSTVDEEGGDKGDKGDKGNKRRSLHPLRPLHPLEVGLACGGTIEVYVEPLAEIHRRLLTALESEETVALATRLDGSGHLLAWPDGRLEGDGSLAARLTSLFPGPAAGMCHTPEGDTFLEVFAPTPTLTIVGAVHVAQPLVRMARVLGLHVRVVDGRRAFATRDRFPTADELIVAWPQEALEPRHLRPEDAVVILTHDPKFDVPALAVSLRSSVGYIGLLGSTTTQAKRKSALGEKGFSEVDLARIHGPVGLDLGGRSPAEIALAILAEVIAVRHGREGDELSAKE